MFGNITPALMQALMKNIEADGGNLLAPKTLSFNKTPQSIGAPVTAAETLAATPQAAEPQSIAPAEVADNRLAPKTLSFNFTPQSLGPSLTAAEMLSADSPAEPEAPEGFEFVGTVNTTFGGPETKAFRKIGDDTGFTIYQREITAGKNKGKQGFFFDDIGDEVATARTGGFLNADDAFNQGRTRSSNYVHHFNTLMDRGVELSTDALDTLNDALAHHDKYLGENPAYAPRRGAILETLNDVQNYMSDSEGVPINIEPGPIQLPVTAPAPAPTPAPAPAPAFETIVNPDRPVPGITEEAQAPETTTPDFSDYIIIDTFAPPGPLPPIGEDNGIGGFLNEDFVDPPITTPAPVYDPGQQISTDPFFNPVTPMQAPNVFDGINYNNPRENFGTTLPTAPATPTVPVVGGNRTYGSYGTYVPPDQVQAVTGVGDNRTYNGFAGTGTPTTFAAPTFVTPTPQDNSGVFDPLREGLGSLFDRAKALQGQSTYVNPFLRPGG